METNVFFPEFQERAAGLYELSSNITLALLTVGLIIKIYQGSLGDVTVMWRAVVATAIIGVLISVMPDWINQLQSAMHGLVLKMDADPSESSAEFARLVTNSVDKSSKDVGFLDVLNATNGGFGKAIAYGLVFLASQAALAFQYVVFMVQQVLIVFGVALLPIFLGFFQINSMQAVAIRYVQGILSVVLWPFGLAVATILTKALLLRASGNGIYEANEAVNQYGEQTFFFVIVLTLWIIVSSFAAPLAVMLAFIKGTNPGVTFLTRLGASASQSGSFAAGAAATSALSGGGMKRSVIAAVVGGTAGAASGAGGGGGVVIPGAIGLAASLGSGGKKRRGNLKDQVSEAANNLRS